jgi:thiomorpholine-carboxylate dehydrogenase
MQFGSSSLSLRRWFSASARSKPLGASGRVRQLFLNNVARKKRVLQQLCDLVALVDLIRLVAKVLHQDNHLAPIARVDDTGVAHQALLRHAGAGFDDAARGGSEFDGYAGVHTGGSSRRQRDAFGRIKIVANVLPGVCYCGQNCIGRESFHFEHVGSFCQMTHNSESQPQLDTRILFLGENAVREVLGYEDLIPAMERALIDFSTGKVLQPVRSILPSEARHGFFGIMPAVYGDLMGAKLVTLFPLNAGTGLPTHQGIIVLLSAATGEPIAVLDGRLITEMRTAAVTAVATNLLASRDASVLAILGSGVQARAHFEALRLVRNFSQLRIWSRDSAHARATAAEVGATAMPIEDAVRGADVVVTVTGASEPILQGKWLKAGVLVNAVGAVGPTRRELDTAAMQGAVVVDSRDAAATESGDILLSGAAIYAEIGEILAGTKPKPSAVITVFKSLGLAVEDLSAGKLVLEKSGR